MNGAIPPTWVVGRSISARASRFADKGGIYPYVKQRGNGGASATCLACADAHARTNPAAPVGFSSPPGQNYVMNQYLQMNWGGLYNITPATGKISKANDNSNGMYSPFNPDSPPSRRSCILLFEAAQEKPPGQSYDASVNRYGTPFYQGFGGTCTSYVNDARAMYPACSPPITIAKTPISSFWTGIQGHAAQHDLDERDRRVRRRQTRPKSAARQRPLRRVRASTA